MVQEYVSPVRVHKYPFEMVMAAYERRFPNCPQIPVVVECPIIDDCWSADDSQRWTTRRCQLTIEAPYLIKKMIGTDYAYFLQKNHLDLRARTLEIEAINETFASKVEVLEKCKYFVHPDNPSWTCFEQTAILDVKSFFGLEGTVEKIAMKQYAANIAKGKELIEVFMKGVIEDGTTELDPWSETDIESNKRLRHVLCRGVAPLTEALPEVTKPLLPPGPHANTLRKRTLSYTNLAEHAQALKPSPSTSKEILQSYERSPRSKEPRDQRNVFAKGQLQFVFHLQNQNWKSNAAQTGDSSCIPLRRACSVPSVALSRFCIRDLQARVAQIEDELRSDSLANVAAAEPAPPSTTVSQVMQAVSHHSFRAPATSNWANLTRVLVSAVTFIVVMTTFFRYLLPWLRKKKQKRREWEEEEEEDEC